MLEKIKSLSTKCKYICVFVLINVMIAIFIVLYYIELSNAKEISINAFNNFNIDSYKVGIEFLGVEDNILTIKGFSNSNSGEMKKYDSFFVLKNMDTSKCYKINTIKKNVGEFQGTPCEYCGMFSKVRVSSLPKGKYKLLMYNNNSDENAIIETNIDFKLE